MRPTALAAMLLLAAEPCAATVRYDAARNALEVSGPIGASDHCLAADLLVRHPHVHRVFIDSPGGDAWAGAQLGRLFAYAGLKAVVSRRAQALSAAGVAALGAKTLRVQGALGLHGPYAVEPVTNPGYASSLVAEAAAEMREVLVGAGLPDWQVGVALAMPRDRMLLVSQQTVNSRTYRLSEDRARIERMSSGCAAMRALLGEDGRP